MIQIIHVFGLSLQRLVILTVDVVQEQNLYKMYTNIDLLIAIHNILFTCL